MENPMKESYVNPQIAEAARWQTRERVALGFSIFFGLIMASAVTDIFLAGAITNFLAASIPFIAPVLSFISFPALPLLVSLISAIAVCICLLNLVLFQHKQLEDIVPKILASINQQENKDRAEKNISEINKAKNKNGETIKSESQTSLTEKTQTDH